MKKLLLPILTLLLLTSAMGQQVRINQPPLLWTDKPGYLAGERIAISARGFQPFESVSLLVTHAGGGAEAGAGHERFFVNAEAGGMFTTSWFVDAHDMAGVNFVVAAAGSAGSSAQTVFARTARIAANRPSYQPGDRVRIRAEGFNPDELVGIRVSDGGHDHELLNTLSDENGMVTANLLLPSDSPDAAFTINATSESGLAASTSTASIPGRIAYHSYVSYNDGSSQLFILDLVTGALTNVSSRWTNLQDPMNAHWSPDGLKLVFMARPKKGGNKYSAWFDVFLYTVGQSGNPVDLTNTPSLHDEDPKFSPDGSKIVYKVRPSTLKEMDLNGNVLNTIISSSGQERSMPYYTADGSAVWFVAGSRSSASIHRIDVTGANDAVVADTPGVADYYPIRDMLGQFLFTRWVSSTNPHDQLYMYDGAKSVSLMFNTPDADYSDAYPVNTQYVVLSSTKSGGQGGYDLYIADRTTGAIWSMNGYNPGVNTNRNELAASYTPVN